ncbi:MAG: hypothetical protein V4622_12245 [Bacteroidota bacterium]
MEIGDVIKEEKIGQRSFEPKELAQALLCNATVTLMSWGAHEWSACEDQWLRFQVNGHHHKGLVYIVLNYNDTFKIYYTTPEGKIVDLTSEVYIDELVEVLDKRIEYIDAYKK